MSVRHGIILVDKPAGITSFQTIGAIKKICNTGKVGHTGTLDKFATGLLVVATGWCTRLVPWFTGMDKRYMATIKFGEETDTLDPEGDVIATAGAPAENEVALVLGDFKGRIKQAPPVYSAIHTSGERAHRLARAGKPVGLKEREVEVHEIKMRSFDAPEMVLCVHCSKGTYIRSLARDIGIAAGSRAHVIQLRRTQVGAFSVDDACAPDAITLDKNLIDAASALGRICGLQKTTASPDIVGRLRNGRPIDPANFDNPPIVDGEVMITERSGEMAAIIEKNGPSCSYRLVVPALPENEIR